MAVRPPAVAGIFYPADPVELAAEVDRYLEAGRETIAALRPSPPAPKALLVPHAGFSYSGPIAGAAYALAQARGAGVRRAVLVGPAHRARVAVIAASSADAFATPLGQVPVDRAAVDEVVRAGIAEVADRAHAIEHGLEVQLPFLQRALPGFAVVPLAIGCIDPARVAAALDALWDGEETLLVISSDLSHYRDYITAQQRDAVTAAAIAALAPERLDGEAACGYLPIAGLLDAARRHRLRATLLDLRNSGDTTGARDEVVGYASFAFA